MINNPYNYHLPVRDDAMFFGRGRLLQRLIDGLTQPRPLSAAIFGGRRCGKTSLLRKLERAMCAHSCRAGRKQLVPWYYDPQAGYPIASGDDFFLLALEMLRRAICAGNVPAQEVESTYQLARRLGPVNAFAEGFALLVGRAGQNIRLVLLVDEAESLLTAPWGSDLRPNLRNLLSNSDIADSLALVMSGSTAFHTQVAEKDSPLENILTRYSLTNLTHEETLALSRAPNQDRLSQDVAEEIWTQTGGHACLAQFILYELWYIMDQATVEDVQDIASEFSDQVDHFERWSDALGPLAHRVYGWLSEQSESSRYTNIRQQFSTADGSELQRTLDMLTYHGLINIAGRGRRTRYQIAGRMFCDWRRQNRAGAAAPAAPLPPPEQSAPPTYDLFDLEIEPRGPGQYEIQVLGAPTGPVRGPQTTLDLSEPALKEMLARVTIGDVDAALLGEIGRRLHAFVFSPPILTSFVASREAARARGRNLCIHLRLHQPELAALPWELLYNPQERNFVVLSHCSPLVRFLTGGTSSPQPAASPPWRMLLVTASPTDWPRLAVAQEQQTIMSAVQPLIDAGQVEVEWLEHATLAALLTALRRGAHWLHFVGHAEYNRSTGQGALILEQKDGASARIDVDTLRHLLPDLYQQSAARLEFVFLNACATAQVGVMPGTRGLAQTLVQAGIPTTIGMSRPISDRSARAFSQGFYEALAQARWPFPVAVTEGRRRVMLESGLHSGDWAVPMLFMRTF